MLFKIKVISDSVTARNDSGSKCVFVPATNDVWTGLNDLAVPGMFTWTDEHMVTFTYWAPGEPNNHDGFSEDCVEMLYQVKKQKLRCKEILFCSFLLFAANSRNFIALLFLFQTGRWNDVSCTELNTYICKMPKAHYPLPSVQPTVYGCPQVGQ